MGRAGYVRQTGSRQDEITAGNDSLWSVANINTHTAVAPELRHSGSSADPALLCTASLHAASGPEKAIIIAQGLPLDTNKTKTL